MFFFSNPPGILVFLGFTFNIYLTLLKKSDWRWRSNAEELIAKVPVIQVADRYAVCEGGSGALGHPIQYIQLDRVNPEPAICKYCGLRYQMAKRINRFGKEKLFQAP
jgi:uncharacterized Zn-finger protein